MYTVKAIEKDTILSYTDINTGKVRGIGTRVTRNCFGVVDSNGKVVFRPDNSFEIYRLKSAAQQQADFLNKQVN